MKGTIFAIVLIASLGFYTVYANNKEETKEPSNTKTEKSNNKKKKKNMATIQMTKKDFLTKVYDFEKDPKEWKYIGDKPALIDFYADWCGPCKQVAPILEELAAEYEGKIYIYKVNTETEQELAAIFGIRSIPSLLFIPMDGQPQMAAGAAPKTELKKVIDQILLNNK